MAGFLKNIRTYIFRSRERPSGHGKGYL